MSIEWTDTDPETGERRFVQAEKFARKWSFKIRFRRRTDWQQVENPTRDMWEDLLEALERRIQRPEGITEDDLKFVRAKIKEIPPS